MSHAEIFETFRKKSYPSASIVGKLYRNALNYINGKTDKLEEIFAQLNINDDEQELLPHDIPPAKITVDQSDISCTSIDKSIQLHPGSPLSLIQNSISIN
ncbi:unnamed protein product, partial [Rotaria sp. Silwood1]